MAFVTDVQVISGGSANICPPEGYTKIDVDLNAGAGGKYIYLCYQNGGRADAIRGLQVSGSFAVESTLHANLELVLHDNIMMWYKHN